MNTLKLPIGLQTFREIREQGYHYVDKTALIYHLANDTKHNFLSRPRRFGKSLLVSTLKELFMGSEKMFRGLAIHDSWDWSVRYPVVHLSFGGGSCRSEEKTMRKVSAQLSMQEKKFGIATDHLDHDLRFEELIRSIREKTGKPVVLLVDEYDKPILDVIRKPKIARANRDVLHDVYSVIKECDDDIKFSFITGISRFSKVSIFSGLNNLWDMTLDPRYSTLCGYTDAELDRNFTMELEGLDREKIRH